MPIDYNDQRFTDLTNQKNTALEHSDSTYQSMIDKSGQYYDNLINQSKTSADNLANIQKEQTEFAVNKIEQQKEQASKDYTKEQKGAYQDYMRQSNAYGSNMQAAGQKGLGGSGWSETIQSGFYNTYQNRQAQARESYNNIVMNYDNNIKEAQLQNSSALAQIYADAEKEQLELALQNFSVIKDLTLQKENAHNALDAEYNSRWRQVEAQINAENEFAQKKRELEENQRYRREQLQLQLRELEEQRQYRQQQMELEWAKYERDQERWEKEYNAQYGSGSGYELSDGSSLSDNNYDIGGLGSYAAAAAGSIMGNAISGLFGTRGGDVKLSNGKNGYSSAIEAYRASGGSSPMSESALIKQGIVKKLSYNGKTYYYV